MRPAGEACTEHVRAGALNASRLLAVAGLVVALAVCGFLILGGGGDGYVLKARFQNAGQVVRGGLVEVAGKRVGNITDLELTDDGLAELTLRIDDEHAPLPEGTTATIRQFGLSGPASRYVELRRPLRSATGRDLPEGSVLTADKTTSNVELDEVFAIFDPKTRRALRRVYRGSAQQYTGEGPRANAGWLYLDPAIISASRLFGELNRDTDELERFIGETSELVGDVAQRREDLSRLVVNVAETTGAIARPPDALADAISQLPGFLRQANTTYVNLRAALDDLDPLVEDFKPVARQLAPYTRELRRLVEDLNPTVRGFATVLRRRGPANDLVDIMREAVPLREIAVGPVRRNGAEREGALPAAGRSLADSTPRLAFARPYSVDFTGWLDDFSHTGFYDALGSTSRTASHVNAFSFKSGVASPIAPALRGPGIKEAAVTGQTNRCPGSMERAPGDGSGPWRPTPDYNCDPPQVPPGP